MKLYTQTSAGSLTNKLRTYKRTEFQEVTLGNWEEKNRNCKGSRMDKTRASTSSLSSGWPEATLQEKMRWGKGKSMNVWFLENLKPKPHWIPKHCGRVDSTGVMTTSSVRKFGGQLLDLKGIIPPKKWLSGWRQIPLSQTAILPVHTWLLIKGTLRGTVRGPRSSIRGLFPH